MAKIRVLNSILTFNRQTQLWECPNDPTLVEHLQFVLENQAPSVNACMDYIESTMAGEILERDPKPVYDISPIK